MKCRLFRIRESSAHMRVAREGSVEAEEVETKGAKAQGLQERMGCTQQRDSPQWRQDPLREEGKKRMGKDTILRW